MAFGADMHGPAKRENDPVTSMDQYRLGNALWRRGVWRRRSSEYRRAVELDPRFFEAFLELGVALKDIGGSNEAIRAFRTAIELRPKSAEAWNNLGTALLLKGRPEEAERGVS